VLVPEIRRGHFMLVNGEGTSRRSPIRTGEVELLEFLRKGAPATTGIVK
jgi:hypothetical protein